MAGKLRKVRAGDPLVIPAATFNAFVDVAQDYQGRQRSTTQDSAPNWRQTGIVPIRNDSDADRARFDVLGISGPVITPTANADAFKERVALKGIVPTAAHVGRFVVLLEPAVKGAIVRAVAAGVTIARVKMNAESHVLADVASDQAGHLHSGVTGSAALLWVEPEADRDPDPAVAWTIAKLGLPGGVVAASDYAVITSRVGVLPPYLYTATAAQMDATGTWSPVTGGAVYDPVFNLEEQGTGGQYVSPLALGDVVQIAPAPGEIAAHVCQRSHYRGTYPPG